MNDEATEVEGLDGVEIVVAGRKFTPSVNTTFEQDLYVMDRMRAGGLNGLQTEVTTEGELNELAQEILIQSYRSGKLFELLAGVLEEEGKEWSPESADENAIMFSKLTDPEDKKALHGSLVGVVLSFFVAEDSSLKISPKSSEDSPAKAPSPAPAPPPRGRQRKGRSTSKSGGK
jgi:hypothetical protein